MTRAQIIDRARQELPYALIDDPLPTTPLGDCCRANGDKKLGTAIDFLMAIGSVDTEDELVPDPERTKP